MLLVPKVFNTGNISQDAFFFLSKYDDFFLCAFLYMVNFKLENGILFHNCSKTHLSSQALCTSDRQNYCIKSFCYFLLVYV
jgi:hypothetical protein